MPKLKKGEEQFAVKPLDKSGPEQFCKCGKPASHLVITKDGKKIPVCTKQACINPLIFPKRE